jgi:ferredoxin--NADP+ reductase
MHEVRSAERLAETTMTVASSSNIEQPEIAALRAAHYNATLVEVLPVHTDLRILRVLPDNGMATFEPGQFLTLGLGNWEPRVEGVDEEHIDSVHRDRLAKRAYSISCSLLDSRGELSHAAEFPYLEFYVALVRHAEKHSPALTPRLFALTAGDRLFAEQHAAGSYTLRGVQPENDVFFFATGTGEAPHNTMIAELLARGHRGRIVSIVSVRNLQDAAYLTYHQRLMRLYSNYWYFVLVTRETAVGPPSDFVIGGRYHLQDFVTTGELERRSGVALEAANSHAFLCGNLQMISAMHHRVPTEAIAKPGSMLDVLLQRGFQPDHPGKRGNVHFECY